MAIDGLTTLSSLFQGDRSSTASMSTRTSTGPLGSNVIPLASAEVDIANRAAAAYSGIINPKKGTEALSDDADSFVSYQEWEEEEEEDEDIFEGEREAFDWDSLDDDEWEEEEEEEQTHETLLHHKQQRGMFLDIHA